MTQTHDQVLDSSQCCWQGIWVRSSFKAGLLSMPGSLRLGLVHWVLRCWVSRAALRSSAVEDPLLAYSDLMPRALDCVFMPCLMH